MRLWIAAVIASATAGPAGAAPDCDYYAFRDAMAAQRDAEFDALLAACRREGRWPEREDAAALSDHTGCVHALLSAGVDPALRTTRDSRWRLSGISRGFGPGLVVRRGATALDLARDQQASARFSTQTHVEVVKQLQAVTPRPGLLGR